MVVDVNTNGNSNNDGFVSGSVNFTQVRSLHSNLRAMRMPLKAAPQKTDLTFSQELNETTLASLPAAPEGKHYVLDNWSKEVNLDAASDWTKTVAVERALSAYLEAYEDMQRKLRELESDSLNPIIYRG